MNVPGNCNFSHLTGLGTTNIVAAGANQRGGILHTITINTKGAASNTLTVNIDGVAMAVIDTTTSIQTLVYDVLFTQSLQVVSATGTGADVTIAWQ